MMMNNTLAQLRELKLVGMATAVEEQLSSTASTALSFEERLALSGAMPMPADTSDTARARRVSNQPVMQAIIGAKIAAAPRPTTAPNHSCNAGSDVARLASARPVASSGEPASTTVRGPTRSDRAPQAMLPSASATKAKVIAVEIPVVDQPVSCAIGRSNTGSENSPPIARQPSVPPAATMTHR